MATFIATAGDDVFNGTAGASDTVDYSGASARINVNLGTSGPQPTGGSGNDSFISIENIIGSAYDDYVSAFSGGTHSFSTGAGDDQINVGGNGVWTVDGGSGQDYFTGDFSSVSQDLTFNFDGQTGSGTLSGGTTLTNIERYGINFGTGNDTINIAHYMGVAGFLDSSIGGGWGSDTFNITGFVGFNNFLYGGVNPAGTAATDTLNVTLGVTTVHDSSINKDPVENSFDLDINTNTGRLRTSQFEHLNYLLDDGDNGVGVGSLPTFDGTVALHVDARGGYDWLTMNLAYTDTEVRNVVWTITGSVTTQSNIGYFDNFEAIDMHLGGGANLLHMGDETDTIYSMAGQDTIDGGGGNDTIEALFYNHPVQSVVYHGGDGTDYLAGNSAADFLSGDAGDDTIDGGSGSDTIDGGSGNDTAVFALNQSQENVFGFGGNIWVYDKASHDLDKLSNIETLQFADKTVSTANVAVFNAQEYLASNPDLLKAFGTDSGAATQHFFGYGHNEGRPIDSFNAEEYLASNADLLNAFGSNAQLALDHYVQFGYGEHRATTTFNAEEYLASNPDLLNAFGSDTQSALDHYVHYGYGEHRATTSFDVLEYIASNPDLITALGANTQAGLDHYTHYGYGEHRATTSFNAAQYIANYPDLAAAFGHDLHAAELHYILYGYAEHRTDHAF